MENVNWMDVYRNKIQSGELKVSKKIQQAIDRHYNDLDTKQDLFYFDTKEVNRVIKFIETLPEPKTGKPMKMALFQKVAISLIYGWRKKSDGTRRFTKAYLGMSRKQGKSLLSAGIALYELILGELPKNNKQIYFAANSTDQANILYGMVKEFADKAKTFSPFLNKSLRSNLKKMTFSPSNSFIKVVSSNASTLDGLDVSLCVLDR